MNTTTTLVTFNAAKIQRLLEHSRATTLRSITLEQQGDAHPDVDFFKLSSVAMPGGQIGAHQPRADCPPGQWLVKDEGIYLMSNGRTGRAPAAVYAHGYRPDKPHSDGWQRQNVEEAAGPDDFATFIDDSWTGPITKFQMELVLDDEGRFDYWQTITGAYYRNDDPRFDRSTAAHAAHDA